MPVLEFIELQEHKNKGVLIILQHKLFGYWLWSYSITQSIASWPNSWSHYEALEFCIAQKCRDQKLSLAITAKNVQI